ncbi:MAG: DNA gyrase C-terminal beta-propeller domain-containing protein, partial [Sarcina sp.]
NLNKETIIENIGYVDEYIFSEFFLGINKSGNIKIYDKKSKDSYNKVWTNSKEYILAFSNKGKIFKFPSYLVQFSEGCSLSKIVDNFDLNETIIKVLSVKETSNEKLFLYFFSKLGIIKKTQLLEFDGLYNNQMAYKFKSASDELIAIELGVEECTVIVATKKALSIKFSSLTVNPMGKVASGVTAISLKDEDEVIFGKCFDEIIAEDNSKVYNELAITANEYKKLVLTTKLKEKKEILIDDIKLQNRAGRGTNLMTMLFDDSLKDITAK